MSQGRALLIKPEYGLVEGPFASAPPAPRQRRSPKAIPHMCRLEIIRTFPLSLASIPTRGSGLEVWDRRKDAMSIARELVAVQVAGVQAFSSRYRARPSHNTAAASDSTMPEGRQW